MRSLEMTRRGFKLKREQRAKKDDKTLAVMKLCVITFFMTFF